MFEYLREREPDFIGFQLARKTINHLNDLHRLFFIVFNFFLPLLVD